MRAWRARADARSRFLPALVLVALAGTTAASASPARLSTSDPKHYEEPARPPAARLALPLRQTGPIPRRRTGLLLHEGPRALRDLIYEPALSRACRAGRFRQLRDRLYVVRLGGVVHGAVQGARRGLFDPDGLARPDIIYAVQAQDTALCRIYRVGPPRGR